MKNKFTLSLVFLWFVTTTLSHNAQNLPGDVDLSFGVNGFVTAPPGDGRDIVDTGREFIVVGGRYIVRYSYHGAVIQQVLTNLTPLIGYVPEDLAIQIDPQTGQPKIIVVGFMLTQTANPNSWDLIIARYDFNLNLDPTFGNGGYVQYQINNYPISATGDVGIQPDGKIIVVGGAGFDHSALRQFIARFQINGSFDQSFGNGTGVTETQIGNYSCGWSVVAQGQDIFVGGSSIKAPGYNRDSTVSRYDFAGNLNPQFNGKGVLILRDGGPVSVAMRDNMVTLAGVRNNVPNGFGLAQVNFAGQLDQSFGVGGFSIRQAPYSYNLAAVARQRDGKVVTVGYALDQYNKYYLLIARYNFDGSPDQSFTSSFSQPFTGTRLINVQRGSSDAGSALAIPESQKIVVAGYSINRGSQTYLLTQFNGF